MVFEFDSRKSEKNKQKYGIDFIQAQALWEDDRRIVFPARTVDEERFFLVGVIDQKHWSVIYTIRDGNIRLISVRRSRKEEVLLYEG